MSYELKYCQVPVSRASCYAGTSGFYPVNGELPDCGLRNGKGLGDDKSSPVKKKTMLRKFEMYLYPYLEEPQRHSQKCPQNVMGWTVAPPYVYVEACQNAIVLGRPKSSFWFFHKMRWKKWMNFLANPIFRGKVFKELNENDASKMGLIQFVWCPYNKE